MSQNGKYEFIAQVTELIESVKRLEDGQEALEELISENHQELMEALRDMADHGNGFSTFES